MQHLGQHENVVNLIGACSFDGDLNVILEYCSEGSLLMYLRSKKDLFVKAWDGKEEHEVGFSILTRIAMQASQGMAFLESKKVKHLDTTNGQFSKVNRKYVLESKKSAII